MGNRPMWMMRAGEGGVLVDDFRSVSPEESTVAVRDQQGRKHFLDRVHTLFPSDKWFELWTTTV